MVQQNNCTNAFNILMFSDLWCGFCGVSFVWKPTTWCAQMLSFHWFSIYFLSLGSNLVKLIFSGDVSMTKSTLVLRCLTSQFSLVCDSSHKKTSCPFAGRLSLTHGKLFKLFTNTQNVKIQVFSHWCWLRCCCLLPAPGGKLTLQQTHIALGHASNRKC